MIIGLDVLEARRLADDLGDAGYVLEARVSRIVEKTGEDVVSTGQANVAVDTGHLRSTIGVDFDPDWMGFEAGPVASYGAHVEFGTVPHEIRPRTKHALYWPGANHPVARVQHPGTAPQPYMIPAFEHHVPAAVTAMTRAAGEIL